MSSNPPQVASPAGSWKGWAIWSLIVRNKTGLKAVAGALFGYLTQQASLITNPQLNTLAGAVVGFLSWGALCMIDYWTSSVPAAPPSGSPIFNP